MILNNIKTKLDSFPAAKSSKTARKVPVTERVRSLGRNILTGSLLALAGIGINTSSGFEETSVADSKAANNAKKAQTVKERNESVADTQKDYDIKGSTHNEIKQALLTALNDKKTNPNIFPIQREILEAYINNSKTFPYTYSTLRSAQAAANRFQTVVLDNINKANQLSHEIQFEPDWDTIIFGPGGKPNEMIIGDDEVNAFAHYASTVDTALRRAGRNRDAIAEIREALNSFDNRELKASFKRVMESVDRVSSKLQSTKDTSPESSKENDDISPEIPKENFEQNLLVMLQPLEQEPGEYNTEIEILESYIKNLDVKKYTYLELAKAKEYLKEILNDIKRAKELFEKLHRELGIEKPDYLKMIYGDDIARPNDGLRINSDDIRIFFRAESLYRVATKDRDAYAARENDLKSIFTKLTNRNWDPYFWKVQDMVNQYQRGQRVLKD